MARLVAIVVVTSLLAGVACSFDSGTDVATNAPVDAAVLPDVDPLLPDSMPSTPDAGMPDPMPGCESEDVFGFLPANVGDPCTLPESGGNIVFDGSHTINTDNQTLDGILLTNSQVRAQPDGGPEVMALVYDMINVNGGATVLVTGSRPLILLAKGDVNIDGRIVARADFFVAGMAFVTTPSPGADVECGVGIGADGIVQSKMVGDELLSGGGGGGGGGFGSRGGEGGEPFKGATKAKRGEENGAAENLIPLRGGCRGGAGGSEAVLVSPVGGFGGGAIEIVSGAVVTINGSGRVAAPGGGGFRLDIMVSNSENSGGGGGGSGGGVFIDARSGIVINGIISTMGGGGGEGRADGASAPGEQGHVDDVLPAIGGFTEDAEAKAAVGGDGGNGAIGPNGDGARGKKPSIEVPAGAGGGGGGLGRVRLRVADGNVTLNGTVVPPPPP